MVDDYRDIVSHFGYAILILQKVLFDALFISQFCHLKNSHSLNFFLNKTLLIDELFDTSYILLPSRYQFFSVQICKQFITPICIHG